MKDVKSYEEKMNGSDKNVGSIEEDIEKVENLINKSTYIVEVYGQTDIKKYKSNDGFSSLLLIEEMPHHYGMCPITVFSLNEDEVSIFDKIMTLQDGYNQLISDEVDDLEEFRTAN